MDSSLQNDQNTIDPITHLIDLKANAIAIS